MTIFFPPFFLHVKVGTESTQQSKSLLQKLRFVKRRYEAHMNNAKKFLKKFEKSLTQSLVDGESFKESTITGWKTHLQEKVWTRSKMSSNCAGVWHLKPKSHYEDFKARNKAWRTTLDVPDRTCSTHALSWGKAGLGNSWQRPMLSFLTVSSQQENHPTGICPGGGLTFCESMEVEQDREMLLDWKHQGSRALVCHRVFGIIASRVHGRSIWER